MVRLLLGKDSVLAQLRMLGLGRGPESPTTMSLVENTAAAVAAVFARCSLDGRWLQVLLRDPPEMIHPMTGLPVRRPPTAVLTQGKRPVALLIGELLVISRAAPRCVRTPLIREARAQILQYEQVEDQQLLQLVADPAG